MQFATSGDCSCFNHTAYLPAALYGTVAILFPYNYTAYAALNLILGVAACYVLARSLSTLFPQSILLCHIATSAMLLNPVMFSQIIQPGLDYLVTILTVVLIAAFLAERKVVAMLIGCLMTSTKEPGIMLYGVMLIGYLLVMLPGIIRSAGLRSAITFAARHFWMAFPLSLFIFYARTFGIHRELMMPSIMESIFIYQPESDLFWSQLASLFLLNFNWILTLVVICYCIIISRKHELLNTPAGKAIMLVMFSLAAGTFFHTRYLVYNNPRYVLPLFAFIVCGFVIACAQVYGRYARPALFLVTIILPLQVWSQFYAVDPISRWAFGTFSFGNSDLLSMGGLQKIPDAGGFKYLGRDQLVYNFQFVKFAELAEQAVQQFGLEKQYVTGPAFAWVDDFRRYDAKSQKRSMKPGAMEINFYNLNVNVATFRSHFEKQFVYLEFPNVFNTEYLSKFRQHFELTDEQIVSSGDYWIRAYVFDPPNE